MTKITVTQTVNVAPAPPPPPQKLLASFTFNPASPQTGQTVTFNASVNDALGNPTGTSPYTYSWIFGDGASGTGASPTHSYASKGSFTVNLTITDSSNPIQTATAQLTVPVIPPPPGPLTASITSSQVSGNTYSFTGAGSGGSPPYSFAWSFADGSTATGATVTHTFKAGATFVVQLTVTDSQPVSAQASTPITTPPMQASYTFTRSSDTILNFTGIVSGGTSPYTFAWDFGDGTTGSGFAVTHTFASNQSFTVKLVITDGLGTTATTQNTFTTPAALAVTFTFTVDNTGLTYTFAAQGSGGTQPYTYAWDFGDSGTSAISNPSHTYAAGGTYTVKVTVTDFLSSSAFNSQNITVVSTVPTTGTFDNTTWSTIADSGCTATIDSNGVAHTTCPSSAGFKHAVVTRGIQASQIPASPQVLIPGRYLHLSGNAISGSGTYYFNECSVYFQFDQGGLNPPLFDLEVQPTHVEGGSLQPAGDYVGSGSDGVHGTYAAFRVKLPPPVQQGLFSYTVDLYAVFLRGIAAMGLPSTTTTQGVVHLEPGIEINGNAGPISTDWFDCSLSGTWPVTPPPSLDPTAMSLLPSAGSVQVNVADTITATVTDTGASPTTPTGAVQFASDGVGTFSAGGSASLSGSGPSATGALTYTPTTVGSGTHRITGSYQADPTHQASSGSTSVTVTSATAGKLPTHIIVILMENNSLTDIYVPQGGSATYMSTLADTYSLALNYQYPAHPSEPNYFALIAGSTFGLSGDGAFCPYGRSDTQLEDLLVNKPVSWRAFAEDATGSGTTSFQPPRQCDHFPFKAFSSNNNAARAANWLKATSSTDNEFIAMLNTSTPWPQFIWLTPNDSNNMHSSSVSTGDTYLSNLVPRILSSSLFQAAGVRPALFIVFDEGNHSVGNDPIYASWIGPTVKPSFKSNTQYDHYSFLRTVEDALGLGNLGRADASASNMAEFFL